MKWGALALALAVLAFTAGALVLTMHSSATSAAQVIPSNATSLLDPVKRALGAKPSCQSASAEGNGQGDKNGDDGSSSRCDGQAGDKKNSGGGDNEPDEKDNGD